MPSKLPKKTKKTTEVWWENVWKNAPSKSYTGLEKYTAVNRRFDNLMRTKLKRGNKKILEIGCARGNWLIYFAKRFGYTPYGIDYSLQGCKLAKKNLELAGLKGTILCEDIFKTSLKDSSFDMVFSVGLIEHFENPTEIIEKHISLVKKGGYLIIIIPNYNTKSIYSRTFQLWGKRPWLEKTHNLALMDIENFKTHLDNGGLEVKYLEYFGPINLCLVFEPRNKALLLMVHAINQALGYATFNVKSRRISSYLVAIGKKK